MLAEALNPMACIAGLLLGFNPAIGFAPLAVRDHFKTSADLLHEQAAEVHSFGHHIPRVRRRHARTQLESKDAVVDDKKYARKYFRDTSRQVSASLPGSADIGIAVPAELDLVENVCLRSYISVFVSLTLVAWRRGLPIIPTVMGLFGSSGPIALAGMSYGLLGAFVVRRVDLWRREYESDNSDMFCDFNWKRAGHDELLEKAVLLGVLPIAFFAFAMEKDFSFGERAVALVNKECTDVQKAILQITGSFASCTLLHCLFQHNLRTRFSNYASIFAMSVMPPDPSNTWWWPFVASSRRLAMPASVVATSALEFGIYLLACQVLLPMATSEEAAYQEMFDTKRKRCEKVFALTGVTREVAASRAEAFEELVKKWERRQKESKKRKEISNLARAVLAAIFFQASGESILAPLLTNIVVTDSVLRLVPPLRDRV